MRTILHRLTALASFITSNLNSSSFEIQDVGDSGWTYQTITPKTVVGATRTNRLASTESGSRIYYIDPENGTIPANQTDALSMVMFFNGTNLIDADGNTAPTSGPNTGVLYGTDPQNPSVSVPQYKFWSMVAPKSGGSEIVYSTAASLSNINTGTSQWRSGKSDWWMFKRGTTWSMYDDVRAYYALTSRSANALAGSIVLMPANGGESATNPAVIGVYGPVTAGRATITHPCYGFFAWFGNVSYPMKHVRVFGFHANGHERNRRVLPPDWSIFPHDETSIATHVYFLNIGQHCFDLKFEDNHFDASSTSVTFQASTAHTATNPQYDWQLHRNLITNAWAEATTARVTVSKAVGDPDQTVSANTEAVVTWPTETTDSDGYFASNTHTLGTSSYSWKYWPLMQIEATIAIGGNIRVSLFKNGTEIDFYTLDGTGVSSDTYYANRVLRPGFATQTSGSTYDIRINSTGATGGVIIKGAATARLVISRLGIPALNGIYAYFYSGSRYTMTENVFLRNGFGVDPVAQTNYIPNGVIPRFDWDTLNHNWYTVGSSTTDCLQTGNVSLLGAAGDLVRNRGNVNQNFFYQGYISVSLEQKGETYTSKTGEFNDNVLLRFRATTGSSSAHPAWGILIATGAYEHEIRRNIISDVHADGIGDFAVKVQAMASPYRTPDCFVWRNSVTNVVIDGNIFDSTHTSAGTEVIQEVNGSNRVATMWMTTVTGTIADGQTLTANPVGTAGVDYTGTPQYEWLRFTAFSDTYVSVLGPGATNTYVLSAAANDFTNNSDGIATSLVVCKVSGITYVTGSGITGTAATNNTVIKPAGKALTTYYSSDSSSGPTGADIVSVPPVPAASNIVTTGTVSYTTRSEAATVLNWPNANASLSTHLAAIGVTVSSTDGFAEYDQIVCGATPATSALRRGRWDIRLLGKGIGNHIRVGRAMPTIS